MNFKPSSKDNILWLTPQELEAIRLKAEIKQRIKHPAFAEPESIYNMMEKHLNQKEGK